MKVKDFIKKEVRQAIANPKKVDFNKAKVTMARLNKSIKEVALLTGNIVLLNRVVNYGASIATKGSLSGKMGFGFMLLVQMKLTKNLVHVYYTVLERLANYIELKLKRISAEEYELRFKDKDKSSVKPYKSKLAPTLYIFSICVYLFIQVRKAVELYS